MSFLQFSSDVHATYESESYMMVHKPDNEVIPVQVTGSMFTISKVLASVTLVLRKTSYSNFKLQQLAMYVKMNVPKFNGGDDGMMIISRYMQGRGLLSAPSITTQASKFRNKLEAATDVEWEKAAEFTYEYLTRVKSYLTATSIEASRRLIIDPIVVAVTSLLERKWSVENRVSGAIGNGPLDYAIGSMPIRSVGSNDTNFADSDGTLAPVIDEENEESTETARHTVHLESKTSNKLDDDALAQFGMKPYDQYIKKKVGSRTRAFGFLTTGQQWLCFSVSNPPDGEDIRPLFQYHGMLRTRLFAIDTALHSFYDSGLRDAKMVDKEQIFAVMCALAACVSRDSEVSSL